MFTYAVGMNDSPRSSWATQNCPGLTSETVTVPDFVGDNQYCETGNDYPGDGSGWTYTWYTDTLLFADHEFQTELESTSNDDVELRIMCNVEDGSDTSRLNEDIGVRSVILFIR